MRLRGHGDILMEKLGQRKEPLLRSRHGLEFRQYKIWSVELDLCGIDKLPFSQFLATQRPTE
jgi:hypothetical protein